MLTYFVSFFWFPWLNFFFENFFIQFFIFYFLFLFFNSNNNYYVLFYFWILLVFFGLYLALSQMELFLGFFWVVEFTVIFISILLLFSLNIEGLNFNLNLYINKLFFFIFFYFFLFFFIFFYFQNFIELVWIFFYDFLNDNFYYSLSNYVLNDFLSLYFNYYLFNSFEFVCIGLILFSGSLSCIFLNFVTKKKNNKDDFFFFKFFSLHNNHLNFSFLRKQNLLKQNFLNSSVRIFKKKNI